MPPRPRHAGGSAQLGHDLFGAQRIFADSERAQRIDRGLERADQLAAEESQSQPLDAGIGFQGQDNEGTFGIRVRRPVGQRLLVGQLHYLGMHARNFHSSPTSFDARLIKSVSSVG